tara:strand:- start:507 stop:1205 length:699 start_codon:yes stop_codon:yes gene_type:complete
METKAKTVLLVEDDKHLGFVVKDYLVLAGFKVDWALDGKEGLDKALRNNYDIGVFDVMLPKLSGFEMAEQLVELKPDFPFLFLTAKAILEDKLKGLKLGRDYLTKPFEFKELEVRIENILQQNALSLSTKAEKFKIGDYQFDYINQKLILDKESQKLTKKEADLLRLLCLHQNKVMPRELALNSIWGNDDYFNGRSMDVFISRLRKYLSKDSSIQLLNIHGVGFKLALKESD